MQTSSKVILYKPFSKDCIQCPQGHDLVSEVNLTETFHPIIKPSNIAGIGLGAFASMNLPANALIGFYYGEVISEAQYERRAKKNDCDYVLYSYPEPGIYIDGKNPELSSWVRYVNHQPLDRVNLVFGPHSSVYTLRAIPEGEELFISYGPDYWDDEQQVK